MNRRTMIMTSLGALATVCGCCAIGTMGRTSSTITDDATVVVSTSTPDAATLRQTAVNALLAADGSHIGLVDHVKRIGFGQDFEHIVTTVRGTGDTISLTMRFRHTNQRGRREVLCTADSNLSGVISNFRVISSQTVN